jgi:hypothetical protein
VGVGGGGSDILQLWSSLLFKSAFHFLLIRMQKLSKEWPTFRNIIVIISSEASISRIVFTAHFFVCLKPKDEGTTFGRNFSDFSNQHDVTSQKTSAAK